MENMINYKIQICIRRKSVKKTLEEEWLLSHPNSNDMWANCCFECSKPETGNPNYPERSLFSNPTEPRFIKEQFDLLYGNDSYKSPDDMIWYKI